MPSNAPACKLPTGLAESSVHSQDTTMTLFSTQVEKFTHLGALGFETPSFDTVETSEIKAFFQAATEQRESLDYDIDGLVFSVNQLDKLARLGFTTDKDCPRGQIALKFPAQGSVVTIREVLWSADGGAHLSPVAIFDPVEIAGAVIRRASLKSYRWMTSRQARFDQYRAEARARGASAFEADTEANTLAGFMETVGVGSVVKIVRSGDVVPCVMGVVSNLVGDPKLPEACPCCGSNVEPNGAYLDCVNPDCEGKVANQMRRFLVKLRVKGLGQDTLVEYAEAGVTLLDFFADDGFATVEQKIRAKGGISLPIWAKIKAQLEAL